MQNSQEQFVRWLYYTRKYPWSLPSARAKFAGIKQFEDIAPRPTDFHETYVPARTDLSREVYLHRYRKHLIFIKTHYDASGLMALVKSLPPGSDHRRPYQSILADRILQSVYEFETLPSRANTSAKKTVLEDIEHLIPGEIDILVGGVNYDMILELDATNDQLVFDLVINHLRKLPCVSQSNTVTARPTFELANLEPVPKPSNKRSLAAHTKDLQRRLLSFLVQRPWATFSEQGDFAFHAETDFKRVFRERFVNKHELAVQSEMPLSRYDHITGYQRYFISIATRYRTESDELVEQELQSSVFEYHDRTYQHRIADVIRNRLLNATLSIENGPQIPGLIGDIRILLGQEDADLLLTFDALDNKFVYEVVLNEIRTIPGVFHTHTAWCQP